MPIVPVRGKDPSGASVVEQEQVRSHLLHEHDRLRLASIQVGSKGRHGRRISDGPDTKPVGGERRPERREPEDLRTGVQYFVLNGQRDKHLIE